LGYDSLFELYLEQKLPGFDGVVSILRDPPAKLKTIDYYPVINTHITDNKAAHECPRYSEDGAKDVGQIQGRLNNILGPGKNSALGPLPTQPLTATGIKLSIILNIYLLYWYFQQNQCLNIKKHAIHNIHRLAWAPMLVGAPGNCPSCPCVKTALNRRHI